MESLKKALLPGILIANIAALLLYHAFGFTGHYGYDDIHYARLAYDLLNGSLDFNDHFAFRTPIIVLTAISYFIFGMSDFSSALPTLMITTGILFVVYRVLKKEGAIALTAGLSLTLFSNWLIHYSDRIMLDNYLAFAVVLALFILYRFRFTSNGARPGFYAFLFTLVLLFGFTSKETIVLIIPFLVFVFLSDMAQKKNYRFWFFTVLYGILLLIVYFSVIRLVTGSYMKRFDAIAANSYLNLCSYDVQSNVILIRRIAHEFFDLTVYQGLFTSLIFVIPALFRYRTIRFLRLESPLAFFVTASVILLLSSNFMSISYQSYIPLCLDPRHYLFLVPVSAIPAAMMISSFVNERQGSLSLVIMSVLTALWARFLPGDTFRTIYFPLALIIALYSIANPAFRLKGWFILAMLLILLTEPVKMVKYARKISYDKQKEAVFDHLLTQNDKYYVITNEVQSRISEYYCKFDDSRFRFLIYDRFSFDTLTNRKIILFNNWYTMYLSNLTFQDLPYYTRQTNKVTRNIYSDDSLQIRISEVTDLAAMAKSDKVILTSFNDFENQVPNWYLREHSITDSLFYSGSHSNKLGEYSATYWYPVDSMKLVPTDKLLVTSSFFCNYVDRTTSKLVIALQENGTNYLWEGLEINRYLKAYSNWWQVKYEYELPADKIRKGSQLQIYLWNADKQAAFVDDFKVTIRKVSI
jgi:4-amino-4-deoxy-L-arabinose transferase-like glycosyltransferase